MGIDDYMDTETGIVAAATAAAVSPRARELFRRGAVYGLAGVLKAGDVAVGAARGAVRGAKAGADDASRTSATSTRQRSRSSQSSRTQTRSKARGSSRS